MSECNVHIVKDESQRRIQVAYHGPRGGEALIMAKDIRWTAGCVRVGGSCSALTAD